MRRRYSMLIIALCAMLLALFLLSFQFGRYSSLDILDPLKIIMNSAVPIFDCSWTDAAETVVLQLRLPRILGAVLVGASLSVAGVSYQALFSNPLASSDTLGVGSAASFGAVLGILIGFGSVGSKLLSFAVGCGAVALIFITARRLSFGHVSTLNLLLVGMIFSSIFSALLSIEKYVADPIDQLPQITYWLLGSLSTISWKDIPYEAVAFFLGFLPLLLLRWRLNLLMLPEQEACSLGQNVTALRAVAIACSTLLTSSSVAITGGISWIGLVVPHVCRLLVGDEMSRLLPLSAVSGAIFLLAIDNLARSLTAYELPISILTSIIGAPIFFALLLRRKTMGDRVA